MKERVVRFRIHEHLYKRFRIVCAQNDLSMAKQNAALVRKFVEIQEENNKLIG
jgi:hypothetical protein